MMIRIKKNLTLIVLVGVMTILFNLGIMVVRGDIDSDSFGDQSCKHVSKEKNVRVKHQVIPTSYKKGVEEQSVSVFIYKNFSQGILDRTNRYLDWAID